MGNRSVKRQALRQDQNKTNAHVKTNKSTCRIYDKCKLFMKPCVTKGWLILMSIQKDLHFCLKHRTISSLTANEYKTDNKHYKKYLFFFNIFVVIHLIFKVTLRLHIAAYDCYRAAVEATVWVFGFSTTHNTSSLSVWSCKLFKHHFQEKISFTGHHH